MGALFLPRPKPSTARLLPQRLASPRVMASPPTVTTNASATLPRQWNAAQGGSAAPMTGSALGGFFTATRTVPNNSGMALISRPDVTTSGTGVRNAPGHMQVSFVVEGSAFEIGFQNTAPFGVLVKVDGEFVTLTPLSVGTVWAKYVFATSAVRRIDVIGPGMSFVSVNTGWTDTLHPAPPVRGPRVICVGDSFTGGICWPYWIADALGWDDIWITGAGGTGYAANSGGTQLNFADRVVSDVIPYAPDIVICVGSVNDWGQPVATVKANAKLFVRRIKAALPNCIVIGGMNGSGGIEQMASSSLDVMDAIRDAYAEEGGVWLNPLEMPITLPDGVPPTSVVAYAVAANTAGFTNFGAGGNPGVTSGGNGITFDNAAAGSPWLPYQGATIEVGSGATRERIMATSWAANGRRLLGFDGRVRYAHAAGEPMKLVGSSYLTGRGKVGAPTGFGNADLYVSNDGTHPSDSGQKALGFIMATMIAKWLHRTAA